MYETLLLFLTKWTVVIDFCLNDHIYGIFSDASELQ